METGALNGLSQNFLYRLLFTAFLALAGTAMVAQDTSDLSNDPHFRDELGVNEYTMPSIEKLFATLDSFKPIPTQELTRLSNSLRITNRIKLALSFDVLIGDGFLAIESENAKYIESLGRELLRRAKGLGVEQQVTRHSKQLLDLAKQSNWSALRRELIATQKEVESMVLGLHDEANGSFAQSRWLDSGPRNRDCQCRSRFFAGSGRKITSI